MGKSILITGIDGFVASTLADHILKVSKEATVYGTIRRMADRKNISHLRHNVHLIDMELVDMNSVLNAVEISKPDLIFHLAAQSYVPTSWTAPANTLETNIIGTSNVLEASRKFAPEAYIQIAGSSEEYGMVTPDECPITEGQPLRPLSPYGVSKVAADRLGYQYGKSYKMNIVISRSFNMTGPRRGVDFVDANWAGQIVNIERGLHPPMMYHGNLDAVRDFTDVRDSVRAYWMLANMRLKHPGRVVNVCTGVGHTMSEVLSTLTNMTTNDVPISHTSDPTRMRPSDVPLLVGSNAKLKGLIDWEPEIPFRQSMIDLLEYWRGRS
jgi:GDP-4-dehydro-6-deoxy-D-mannose reductase